MSDRARLSAWLGLIAFLVAIAYAGRFAEGTPDRDVLYRWSTAAGAAIQYGIILLVVLAIARPRWELLAWRRPRSWPAALVLGLAILVGIYLVLAVLEPLLHGGEEQGLTPRGWDSSRADAYAGNFVAVAVIAPIVEELTFRGLGFSLLARFGKWIAIGGVGVAFALAHGLLQAFPELAIFGCALAWLRWRTDSVLPGIVVHAIFNALALIAAVTIDQ
jgi:membrane protease YdiL (CAAX protease family)